MASVSKPTTLKNGDLSYRLTESMGYDDNGKLIQARETIRIPVGTSAKERKNIIQERKRDFESRISKGLSNSNPTYKEVCKEYLENAKIKRKGTMESWLKSSVKEFGDVRIKDLRRAHLRKYVDKLNKKTYAPTTIKNYFKAVSCVLSYACEEDLIETNCCLGAGIKLPESRKKDRGYGMGEINQILKAINQKAPLFYIAYFELVASTGARRGEACGLKWDNIDFENRTITIEESADDSTTKGIIYGPPKTEKSLRTIPVSGKVIDLLRQLKTQQNVRRLELGSAWLRNPKDQNEKYCENHENCDNRGYCSHICRNYKSSDRVFVLDNGVPARPQSIYQWYKRFLKNNNLPDGTIHGWRHVVATRLYAEGVPLPKIARYLGHSGPAITATIYAETISEDLEQCADTMAEVLAQ